VTPLVRRPIDNALTVSGLGAGVNVLAAGNEAGKSTLFRAIRICLFKRHNSNDTDIRELGCAESQLPCSIALTFEHEGRTYEIRKSFIRSVSASLWENGREIARGREADEKVWELFGIGAGSGRTIDSGAFGVLWVGQGSAITVPAITGKADAAITAAIEVEVGNLVGGERARTVLTELSSQITQFLTKGGRLAGDGPLGIAQQNLTQFRQEETELANRLAVLETHFNDLSRLKGERARLTDPAARHAIDAELANTEKSLKQGQEAANRLKSYESQERAAHAKLETATQRLNQLTETITRIDGGRGREAKIDSEIEALVASEGVAREAVEATKAQSAEVERELDELNHRSQTVQLLLSAVSKTNICQDWKQKLASLENSSARLVQIAAELDQIAVTPEQLKAMETIERQQLTLEAQLAVRAPQLLIELQKNGVGRVHVGDKAVGERFSEPVLMPAKITIADIATITVTPAIAEASEHESKRRKLDDDQRKLLRKAGVASPADAAAAIARRLDLEAQRQGARAELKTLGNAGDDASDLIADLTQQLANAGAAIQDALTQSHLTELPDVVSIEAEQADFRTQRDEFQRIRSKLAGTREVQDETLEAAVAKRSGAEAELTELRRALQFDLTICPDSERVARLAELSTAVDHAKTAYEQASGALSAQRGVTPMITELERLENRHRRLQEQVHNRSTKLSEFDRDIARLEGQIENAGGDGIGESLASTQEQRELAEREVEKLTRKLDALQLLQKAVSDCLSEGQDRYYAPVRRHLQPFLNDLFPGAELQLGSGFGIEGLKRSSAQSEPFGRLSDGTREQIAVLVRLALGAMLAERGQAIPIILDDALVYSDDDRITHMFDALSRAGQHQQIIVLTCRTRAFEQLGGRGIKIDTAVA
jgi:uncharacterized protein YhaN